MDEIVANNPVEIAEDFDVPAPSDEQMQQMQQQQQQQQQMMGGSSPQDDMPPAAENAPKGKTSGKSEPKK